MYVLGIVGSPQKRNTYLLVQRVLQELSTKRRVNVELVHLADINIKHCQGCGFCRKTANCLIDDDMGRLCKKLTKADALVIGSPTYFWDVSGLLKDFIDRTNPLCACDKLKGKIGAAIVTASVTGQTKALSAIESFFQIHGIRSVGGIALALREYGSDENVLQQCDLGIAQLLGEKIAEALTGHKEPTSDFR